MVFNTPGANANAVKELVICGLLLSSRRIVPAIEWCQSLKGKGDEVSALVEKGKSNYTGPEIKGKTLGVIGLGAIGVMVANAAVALGMKVVGYDPYLTDKAATSLDKSVKITANLDDVFAESHYISLMLRLPTPQEELQGQKPLRKCVTVSGYSTCKERACSRKRHN